MNKNVRVHNSTRLSDDFDTLQVLLLAIAQLHDNVPSYYMTYPVRLYTPRNEHRGGGRGGADGDADGRQSEPLCIPQTLVQSPRTNRISHAFCGWLRALAGSISRRIPTFETGAADRMAPENGHGNQILERMGQGVEKDSDLMDHEFDSLPECVEGRDLALTCDLCCHRMQTVADLLLLTRCRDTVASRTRGLSVLLRDLAALTHKDTLTIREMGDSSSEEETMAVALCLAVSRAERDEHLLLSIQRRIRVCVEEICDLVVSLTECCAHAGYLLAVLQDGSTPEVPGAVDRYQLCRAAAEIEHKTGLLRTYRLHTITSLQLTDICINVTESANILTDSCLKAADEALQGNTREQFRLCLKSVAAALNTFCGSIKFLKDLPDECNYRACQVFGEALTTTCNALAVFATQDSKLTGTSAKLSPAGIDTLHDVLSACMGVVSPCVLVCSIVRDVAGHWDDKVVTRVQQCHGAVLRSSNKLTEALGGFGSEERKDNGKMWMDEDSQWPSHPSEHSTGQIVSGHRFYPQQHGDEWRGKAHVQEEFQSIVLTAISHIWGYRQLVHEVERLRTIQYDADDSSHEDKLLKLWGLLMPDVHLKSRVTKQWQEIGFQGDDPKTDFRGMGILGLENLIYFAEEYPGPASHVLSHSHHPQYGYAFAIVGINLTFMAYHLLKDGLAKTHVYNVSKIFPDIKEVVLCVSHSSLMSSDIIKPRDSLSTSILVPISGKCSKRPNVIFWNDVTIEFSLSQSSQQFKLSEQEIVTYSKSMNSELECAGVMKGLRNMVINIQHDEPVASSGPTGGLSQMFKVIIR
uniref:(California timema) hypothetical protein n=1 Tax=Timema californicum TaxID=61474 RepID=A0A7R9IVM7_TIMCA|nr:unnamed protein product [Timema californicum]